MSRSISATRASVVRGPSFRFAAIDLPHLQAEADDDEQNRAERDEQAATAVAELGDPVLARVIDRGDNRDAVGNDPGDLGRRERVHLGAREREPGARFRPNRNNVIPPR